MSVCIIGNKGNMGRRYAAILKIQGIDFCGFDLKEPISERNKMLAYSNKVIVATPTLYHLDILNFIETRVPEGTDVLCEKPVVKTACQLSELKKMAARKRIRLFMVNQYALILLPNSEGETYYNFYHSGGDGLLWDCIQLIHLAKDGVRLRNTSPFWTCTLNGETVKREWIDSAYVSMINDFLGPMAFTWGISEIEKITQRLLNYESTEKNFDRHTSEIYLPPASRKSAHGNRPKADSSACGRAVQKSRKLPK